MGKLTVHDTPFNGVYTIETNAFRDDRGAFARWFCDKELESILDGQHIVNVNFSKTVNKGSIRGMHFQYPPHTETKIIRCIRGKILDVIVDIRKGSPTFLQHLSFELSEDNMMMLYIPKGFAHGFQSIEDDSEIMYLVTEYYSAESESGLNPMDPSLGIKWPLLIASISDKDRNRELLNDSFKGI
jgi:dTDP-4-dehydrorhamnose 3,5-epimerase